MLASVVHADDEPAIAQRPYSCDAIIVWVATEDGAAALNGSPSFVFVDWWHNGTLFKVKQRGTAQARDARSMVDGSRIIVECGEAQVTARHCFAITDKSDIEGIVDWWNFDEDILWSQVTPMLALP
jgi:hypothetical protein